MVFRFLFKFGGFVILACSLILERQCLKALCGLQRKKWNELDSARQMSRWCLRVLYLLDIQVEVAPNWKPGIGRLIAANHLGLIDALILAAQEPILFITSNDIGAVPFLGILLRQLDCLFVERRHNQQLIEDQSKILKILSKGCSVLLFPEGTSTLGDRVLPFKTGLLRTALIQPIALLPVSLAYQDPSRVGLTKEMSLWGHLWRIFSGKTIYVKIIPLEETKAQKGEGIEDFASRIRSEIIQKQSFYGSASLGLG